MTLHDISKMGGGCVEWTNIIGGSRKIEWSSVLYNICTWCSKHGAESANPENGWYLQLAI